MKYLELKNLVEAIQPLISGAFIDKLDFINEKTLQIRLNQKTNLRKLVLVAKPQDFFFVNEKHLESPKQPLSATMAFRKYVGRGILENVEILPNNRIVKLSVNSALQKYYIFIEFFGSCDFILTDTDLKILALLKYYKDENRELKVHNTYIVPKSHFELDDDNKSTTKSINLVANNTTNDQDIVKQQSRFWDDNFKESQPSAPVEGKERIEMLQKTTLEKYLKQKDEFAKKGKYILENLSEIQNEFEKARANRKNSFKFGSFSYLTDKNPSQQAQAFFEKSKNLKEKITKIEQILKHAEKAKRKKKEQAKEMFEIVECTEFYAKYHWFFSSSGFLCFGGRSAEQNEEIMKNLVKKDDIILHTDTPGSPFFIIRSDGRKIDEQTIQEAAQATVSYSRYWRNGYSSGIADVFAPNQVKKTKNLPVGTFLVEGKIRKVSAILELAIGIKELETPQNDTAKVNIFQLIGGPTSAILQATKNYVILQPGKISKPEILKRISEKFKVSKPEIEKFLPSGEYKLI